MTDSYTKYWNLEQAERDAWLKVQAIADAEPPTMTDRELVLELCKRLGLTKPEDPKCTMPDAHNYTELPRVIRIGAGIGDYGSNMEIDFNVDGTLNKHGIWG